MQPLVNYLLVLQLQQQTERIMKSVALFRKPLQWSPVFPSNLTKYYLYKDIVLKKQKFWSV